jgi:hypothetical protein
MARFVPHRPGPAGVRHPAVDRYWTPTLFDDVVSASVPLAGTPPRAATSDAPTGTVPVTGTHRGRPTRTPSPAPWHSRGHAAKRPSRSDSVSGTVALSGTSTEVKAYGDSPSGTTQLSGDEPATLAAPPIARPEPSPLRVPRAPRTPTADAPSGTVPLTGTAATPAAAPTRKRALSRSPVRRDRAYPDAPSGSVPVSGASADARSAADSQSGTVPLTGSATESKTYTDAPTGSVPSPAPSASHGATRT